MRKGVPTATTASNSGKSSNIASLLWDDDEEEDSKVLPPAPAKDYKHLFEEEQKKRLELEELVTKLEIKISLLKEELSLYKGLQESTDGANAEKVDMDSSDNEIPLSRQISSQPKASNNNASAVVPSSEWQLLAEQEKERRQKARMRNVRANTGRKPVVSASTTITNQSQQLRNEAEETPQTGNDVVKVSAAVDDTTIAKHAKSSTKPAPTTAATASEKPVELNISKKTAVVANWDASSDEEGSNKPNNDSAPAGTQSVSNHTTSTSTSGVAALQTTDAEFQSEWSRLAQEERDRKQKARQQQLQQQKRAGNPRNRLSARQQTAAPSNVPHAKEASSGTTRQASQPNSSSAIAQQSRERRNSNLSGSGWSDSDDDEEEQPNANTQSAPNRARDDSFFDSDSDSDSNNEPVSPPTTSSTPSSAAAEMGSASGMSRGSNRSNTQLPTTGQQLESQIDEIVLRWAYGKSISRMLQTVPLLITENVPSLGPQWADSVMPPQDPASVRKAFLLTVRCCHPDKVGNAASEREQLIAAKVFAALTDAYNAFKQQHGL